MIYVLAVYTVTLLAAEAAIDWLRGMSEDAL